MDSVYCWGIAAGFRMHAMVSVLASVVASIIFHGICVLTCELGAFFFGDEMSRMLKSVGGTHSLTE